MITSSPPSLCLSLSPSLSYFFLIFFFSFYHISFKNRVKRSPLKISDSATRSRFMYHKSPSPWSTTQSEPRPPSCQPFPSRSSTRRDSGCWTTKISRTASPSWSSRRVMIPHLHLPTPPLLGWRTLVVVVVKAAGEADEVVDVDGVEAGAATPMVVLVLWPRTTGASSRMRPPLSGT